jgi:hypothetical protein
VELPEDLASERYCVLTTEGRVTGRRHAAELWFVPALGGVHLMSGSGGLTSWCLNLQSEGQAVLRIGPRSWLARAAFLDRDVPERAAVLERFQERYGRDDPARRAAWLRDATVVHMVFTHEL